MTTPKLSPTKSPEKTLVTWTVPARPYKKRNREYYTTIASISFLLGVILLLMKEFLLIGVVFAFAFLSYVLASVPPQNIKLQISSKGIKIDNQFFPWDQLLYYWTTQKWGFDLVNIKTKQLVSSYLIFILDPKKKSTILKTLDQHLIQEKPEASFVDKASRWLQEKVPLETQS